jgi:hypothetical protein
VGSLADRLARYAAPIVRAWISSGEIFILCWSRKFRTSEPQSLTKDEVDELVFEMRFATAELDVHHRGWAA